MNDLKQYTRPQLVNHRDRIRFSIKSVEKNPMRYPDFPIEMWKTELNHVRDELLARITETKPRKRFLSRLRNLLDPKQL